MVVNNSGASPISREDAFAILKEWGVEIRIRKNAAFNQFTGRPEQREGPVAIWIKMQDGSESRLTVPMMEEGSYEEVIFRAVLGYMDAINGVTKH